jgi:hypothetical protein
VSVLLRTIYLYKSAINEVQISMFMVLAEARVGLTESSTHRYRAHPASYRIGIGKSFLKGKPVWEHDECVSLSSVA